MTTLQEYRTQDDAFSKQYDAQQAAQAAAEAQKAQPPTFLQQATAAVGHATVNTLDVAMGAAENYFNSDAGHKVRDAVAGGITGAVDAADTARDSESSLENKTGIHPPISLASISSPIWDHAKQHVLDFRDAVAVQDPTMVDRGVQALGQFLPSFLMVSRAAAGLHWAANAAVSGFAADAIQGDPTNNRQARNLPRVPDIFAAAKHSQGKYVEALEQASNVPGELVNHFVNYVASDGSSPMEERFKNGIEGAVTNTVMTPVLHAAGVVFKHMFEGLRYAIRNGVGSADDLMPANQVGAAGELPKKDPTPRANNASGESSASQEAINRLTAEKDAGITRWNVDPDGQLMPLTGVDAVDLRASKGHLHITRDAEDHESITDRGGLSQAQANGLLARSKLMRTPEGSAQDTGPEGK